MLKKHKAKGSKGVLKRLLAGVCSLSMILGTIAAADMVMPQKMKTAEAAVTSLSVGDRLIFPAMKYYAYLDSSDQSTTPQITGVVIAAGNNSYTIQTYGLTAGRYPSITDEETEEKFTHTDAAQMYVLASDTSDAANVTKGIDMYNEVTKTFVRKYKELFVNNTHLYLEDAQTLISKAPNAINSINSKYTQYGADSSFIWTKDENEGAKGNVTGITAGTKTAGVMNYNTKAVIAPAFRLDAKALKYFSENEDGDYVVGDSVPEDTGVYPGDKLVFNDMKKPKGESKKDVIEGYVVGETPTAYIIQTTGVDAGPWPGGLGTSSSGTNQYPDYTFATEEEDILNPKKTAINRYHTYTKAFYDKYSFLFDTGTKLYMPGISSNYYSYNNISMPESQFQKTSQKIYDMSYRCLNKAAADVSSFGTYDYTYDHHMAWLGTPCDSSIAYNVYRYGVANYCGRSDCYTVAPAFNLSKSALGYLTKSPTKSGMWNVSGTPVTLSGIDAVCTRSDVQEGDVLTADDFIVTANYSDGSSKEVPSGDYTVTVKDNTAGMQPVTVTYKDMSCIVNVNFAGHPVTLNSITASNSKTYYAGNVPPASDFIVKGIYSDGTVKDIPSSECTVTAPDTTVGTHTVTVSYGDVSTPVQITFVKKEAPAVLSSIIAACRNGSDGKGYKVGSAIPNSEFDVKAVYSNGTYKTLDSSDFTVSVSDNSKGWHPAVIRYNGFTTSAYVLFKTDDDVPAGQDPVSISAVCSNNRIIEGDQVSPSDFTITAVYPDGKTYVVSPEDCSIVLNDSNAHTVGSHKATITFKGISTLTDYMVWKMVDYDPSAKIKELTDTITGLNKQLADMRTRAENAESKRDALQQQINDLRKKLADALANAGISDTSTLEEMIDKLITERDQYKSDYETAQSNYEKYKKLYEDTLKELNDTQAKLAEALRAAAGDNKDLTDQINALNKQIEALKKERDQYKSDCETAQSNYEKYKKLYDDTAESLTQVRADLEKAQALIAEKDKTIGEKDKKIAELEQRIKELESTTVADDDKLKAIKENSEKYLKIVSHYETIVDKLVSGEDLTEDELKTIAGADKILSDLHSKITDLEKQLKTAEDLNKTAQKKIDELTALLKDIAGTAGVDTDGKTDIQIAEEVKKAITDAKEKNGELEKTLEDKSREIEKLTAERDRLQKEIDDARKALREAGIDTDTESLKDSIKKLTDEKAELEKLLKEAQEKIDELSKNIPEAIQTDGKFDKDKFNAIIEKAEKYDEILSHYEKIIDKLISGDKLTHEELKTIAGGEYVSELEAQIKALNGTISENEAKITDLTERLAKALKTGEDLAKELEEAKKNTETANSKVSELEKKLEENKKTISDLEDSLAEARKNIESAQSQIDDLNKELDEKKADLEKALENSKDTSKDIGQRLKEAQDALAQAIKDYDDLKKKADASDEELEQAKKNLENAQAKVDSLKAINDSLTETNNDLRAALEAALKNINNANEKITDLNSQLEEMKKINDTNVQEIAKLEGQIKGLTDRINEFTEFINKLYVIAGGDLNGKSTKDVEEALKEIINVYIKQKDALAKIDKAMGGNGSTDPDKIAENAVDRIKNGSSSKTGDNGSGNGSTIIINNNVDPGDSSASTNGTSGSGSNGSASTDNSPQIDKLTQQVKDLTEKNKALSDTNDQLNRSFKDLSDDNADLTKKNQSLSDTNDSLTEENEKLAKQKNRVKTVTKTKTVTKKVPVTRTKVITKKTQVPVTKVVTKTKEVPVTKVVTREKQVPVTKVITREKEVPVQQAADPSQNTDPSKKTDPSKDGTIDTDPQTPDADPAVKQGGSGEYIPEVPAEEHKTASGDAHKAEPKQTSQTAAFNPLPVIVLAGLVAALIILAVFFMKKKQAAAVNAYDDDDADDDDIEDDDVK